LRKEAPGILGWMVEGCFKWQGQGLDPPAAIVEASRKNIETADVLNQFVDECCVEDPSAKVVMRRFYDAWSKWCADRNRPAGSEHDFRTRMLKRWPRIPARAADCRPRRPVGR
jgi:putative DNA primase/helicase